MVLGRRMSVAARLAKARSKEIDLRLQNECNSKAKEVKLLLFGPDDVQRSTVFKAIRMVHQDGLTLKEQEDYRAIIYRNLVDSARTLVDCTAVSGFEYRLEANREHAQQILDFKLDPHSLSPSRSTSSIPQSHSTEAYIPGSSLNNNVTLPYTIAHAIHEVWNDPAVRELHYNDSRSLHISERAKYFLDSALRIATADYVVTETDFLRARERTNGVVEAVIPTSHIPIRIFTVGSHSPRQKWLQCFESVSQIVFCVSVGDYADVVLNGQIVNRLQESLVLFRSILCSPWFVRTKVTLLLVDVDLLQRNLSKIPLDEAFPAYDGEADVEKAKKFILRKFLEENRRGVNVHPYFVQSVDAECLRTAVYNVTKQVVESALKH